MATATKFDREMMQIDRVMEFFTEDELSKQIGYTQPWWPAAELREMIDNGLDAVESAGGETPLICIEVQANGLRVEDNGPGLPWEVVERSIDYTHRVTDKAFFVAPTRGRQGNALLTLWAAPYVVDGDEGRVTIESRGTRRVLSVTTDPIGQQPVLELGSASPGRNEGTSIHLQWPDIASDLTPATDPDGDSYDEYLIASRDDELSFGMRSAVMMARAYAMFNPHAHFAVHTPSMKETIQFKPRCPDWKKWTVRRGTPAHWYTTSQLRDLAASLVRVDVAAGRKSRSVREFVTSFPGLSGSIKAPEVIRRSGIEAGTLRELFDGGGDDARPRFEALRAAMLSVSPPADAENHLGTIGRVAFISGMERILGCDGKVRYKKVVGQVDDVPFVLEAGFGSRTSVDRKKRVVVAGVNWSPALRLPFEGLADGLTRARIDADDPVVIAIHLVYPGAAATDRGKSRYDLPDEIREVVLATMEEIASDWKKVKDKRSRAERVSVQDFEKVKRGRAKAEEEEIKANAYRVMAESYAHAAGNVGMAAARQIMYSARKRISDFGGRLWKKSQYFTQTLLVDYMASHREETDAWDVLFDSRGNLLEPHTGVRIPLGTVQVRDYIRGWGRDQPTEAVGSVALKHDYPTSGPGNRFKFALFVEKEGYDHLFAKMKLAEKYDIAIFSTKGMTVVAARKLADDMYGQGVTVLALHDFDKSGFGILNTLQADNNRYRYKHKPKVIDIGLRLADAQAVGGVLSEAVQYATKKDPRIRLRQHGATEEECNFLVSKNSGKKLWEGERVELNALTSDQLLDYLSRKFDEHGVTKLIPGERVLREAYQRACRIKEAQDAVDAAIRKANALPNAKPPGDLEARIHERVTQTPALSWDEAIWQEVQDVRFVKSGTSPTGHCASLPTSKGAGFYKPGPVIAANPVTGAEPRKVSKKEIQAVGVGRALKANPQRSNEEVAAEVGCPVALVKRIRRRFVIEGVIPAA